MARTAHIRNLFVVLAFLAAGRIAAQEDVADILSQRRTVGNDPTMSYFLTELYLWQSTGLVGQPLPFGPFDCGRGSFSVRYLPFIPPERELVTVAGKVLFRDMMERPMHTTL
jgi:hypothetical protein